MNKVIQGTQSSYDRVAVEYAEGYKDEMDNKPFDRSCLDRPTREVGDLGRICDLGCGPGQIASYLHRQGVKTLGVDLSANMVAEAQRLNPEIRFYQGNMLSLPDPDEAWGDCRFLLYYPHSARANCSGAPLNETCAQTRRSSLSNISY